MNKTTSPCASRGQQKLLVVRMQTTAKMEYRVTSSTPSSSNRHLRRPFRVGLGLVGFGEVVLHAHKIS